MLIPTHYRMWGYFNIIENIHNMIILNNCNKMILYMLYAYRNAFQKNFITNRGWINGRGVAKLAVKARPV